MKETKKWALPEYEIEFRKGVVSEYLKYGSVDALMQANHYDIPMSEMSIHRIISDWGIIKSAGPNGPFLETISFFVKLAEKRVPLEALYTRMPSSFTTAAISLHRSYRNLKENVKRKLEERDLRRVATALVITREEDPKSVLVGFDVSPRKELGKPYGSVSVPMGFSKRTEARRSSILRVLQQEVFMEKVIERAFPYEVLPESPKPFMYVDIADIRVAVYSIALPKTLVGAQSFSSHRLKKHQFLSLDEAALFGKSHVFRVGLSEIFEGYQSFLRAKEEQKSFSTLYIRSWLNTQLEDFILTTEGLQPQPAV